MAQAPGARGARAGDSRPVVDRQSSSSQVASYLRASIFAGTLRPGDYVRQNELAKKMGVSRIPVREALVALEREGWISIEPHRGAFVNGFDENSIRDHYALLGELYGLAAERATERGDADGFDALDAAERVLLAADDPDAVRYASATYLHQTLAMARSPRLHSFSRLTIEVVLGNLFAHIPEAVEEHKRGVSAAHRAIRKGDGALAYAEFAALLRGYGDHAVDLLRARGIL
ncbi:GntR family transcriptional regulator [Frankia sp. CNm7]|uniref:GntR family transcriptional regulator n=2 Tax=Frankia nepalensis TaxID=1836974 RepID=A0A937R8J6_9ACTN|nr:GntR family transcriptional regulator [Frankia nepalensis]MBL7511885.1 GntR family transcriptional regulator [Frankia nepalensis]MBL7516636.1 GntR family transcriptional regulator [Frankia nepalensis]MBL7627366.1 GntR family transcriptional regulator [Frankia nepalensis]